MAISASAQSIKTRPASWKMSPPTGCSRTTLPVGARTGPALDELLSYARAGDTVIVHSIDRLARNLNDLLKLVKSLTERGVRLEFYKENLVFAEGENDPISRLLLANLGAYAEFERSLLRERQREGIALAKQRGVYANHGRPLKLSQEEIARMKELAELGWTRAKLACELGIRPKTLAIYLKREGITLRRKPAGRKHTFSDEQAIVLKRKFEAWEGKKGEFAKMLGMSRATLYRYLKKAEALLSRSEVQSQASLQ